MRIFKNKTFNKWAKELKVADEALLKIVEEIKTGMCETNLGGHIYKKRVPINGKGKRSGLRVIIAFKVDEITIFVYGFPKNNKDNITNQEKEALKALAKIYFTYSDEQFDEMVNARKFFEVETL